MSNKVNEAEKATDNIFSLVRSAHAKCESETPVNFYGVMREPREYKAKLQQAIDALTMASALIDSTKWPTNSDYDGL